MFTLKTVIKQTKELIDKELHRKMGTTQLINEFRGFQLDENIMFFFDRVGFHNDTHVFGSLPLLFVN